MHNSEIEFRRAKDADFPAEGWIRLLGSVWLKGGHREPHASGIWRISRKRIATP